MSRDNEHINNDGDEQPKKGEPIFYTADEAADKIGKSVRTLHHYLDIGLIECLQPAKNYQLQFLEKHIDDYWERIKRGGKKD